MFGEAGIAYDNKKIRYLSAVSLASSSNVSKFSNFNKHTILQSRIIVWLNMCYFKYIEKYTADITLKDYIQKEKSELSSLYPEELLDYFDELQQQEMFSKYLA
jgi:hypothetical protein